eukprot:Skav226511  [mRNA]  locus=scaffold1773:62060:65523:- [translate_table: standard]
MLDSLYGNLLGADAPANKQKEQKGEGAEGGGDDIFAEPKVAPTPEKPSEKKSEDRIRGLQVVPHCLRPSLLPS